MDLQVNSLTTRANGGLLRVIQTEVKVSQAFTDNVKNHGGDLKLYNGIWDTGATGTVISKKVVNDLKLKPVGMVEVHTANGTANQNQYLVNVILVNEVVIQGVKVTEATLRNTDVLIGMDIITLGDLSITNFAGNTIMSYRIPSCHEVDFDSKRNQSDISRFSKADRIKLERYLGKIRR